MHHKGGWLAWALPGFHAKAIGNSTAKRNLRNLPLFPKEFNPISTS
jgi:hypothetical protein